MVPFQIVWRDGDGVPLLTSTYCVLIYKAFAPRWYICDATAQLTEGWGFGTPGKKHSIYCVCCHLSTRKARAGHTYEGPDESCRAAGVLDPMREND